MLGAIAAAAGAALFGAVSKRVRIIDRLRKIYPNLVWTYDAECNCWRNNEGWAVEGRAHAVSTVNGPSDDEWYVEYYRTDTGDRVTAIPPQTRHA